MGGMNHQKWVVYDIAIPTLIKVQSGVSQSQIFRSKPQVWWFLPPSGGAVEVINGYIRYITIILGLIFPTVVISTAPCHG